MRPVSVGAARCQRLVTHAMIWSALALLAAGCEPKAAQVDVPRAEVEAPQADDAPRTSSAGEQFMLSQLEHEIATGAPQEIAFEITPGKGLKINPQYPWKLVVDAPPAGLTLAGEPTIKKEAMRIDAKHAKVPLSVSAAQPGSYELTASVNLSVCEQGDEARCLWFTDEPVTLRVEAKSAEPAVEAPDTPPAAPAEEGAAEQAAP